MTLAWLVVIAQVATPDVAATTTDPSERVPVVTAVPDYPATARRDRIEGEVEVCFEVDRDGNPRRIGVRRSTNRVFEKPSIRAIRASRYEAIDADADYVGIKTCRVFTFRLEPGSATAGF